MSGFPVALLLQGVTALLHEPFGGAGGAADADGMDAEEPGGVDFLRAFYEVTVGIYAQALVEEHLAVGTLAAADEEHQIVAAGKLRDVGHAVGNGTADGVEAAEGGVGRDVLLDILDDAVELVERLRGLGIEIDVAREVKTLHLVEVLDDDGGGVSLSHKT